MSDVEKVIPNSNFTLSFSSSSTKEKVLIVLAVLSILIAITLAILLGVGVNGKTKSMSSEYCTTRQCLREASRMQTFLNTTIDPCTNFYAYACNRWENRMSISPSRVERTILTDTFDINTYKLQRILSQRPELTLNFASENKLKNFFYSCVNQYMQESLTGKPLVDIITNKLNNWYVFDGDDQRNSFDFDLTLQKVHVDYWINAIFSFFVSKDQVDPTKRIIEVRKLSFFFLNFLPYAHEEVIESPDQISSAISVTHFLTPF